ncbi:MAG: 50S ribosomal protein L24 [Thermoplasmatales archaeon]|nr:MAG: 50S ribosomal protein L24 [Thermoplasmatales archaeon]
MESIKARKQRKELFNAPLHKKRKWTSSHLEENLLLKYDKRALPVVKGDTVKVMRGSFKGHEDKIVRVNVKKRFVEIEGLTMSKADGNKIAKPIHASNLMITKLNLTDKWRRKKLQRGLSEEAKKEIEEEAEEQIKVAEEEQKKKEEEEKETEEEIEEEPIKDTIETDKKKIKEEDKKEIESEIKTGKEVKKETNSKKQPKTTKKKTKNKETTVKKSSSNSKKQPKKKKVDKTNE